VNIFRNNLTFVDLTGVTPIPVSDKIVFPARPVQHNVVRPLISQSNRNQIQQYLERLCAHSHRRSNRDGSQASVNWIKATADAIIAGLPEQRRTLFTVQLVTITGYFAPSVIITFKGSSEEAVIFGAHADDVGHP